ncbi:MAG: hypothetical protein PHP62_03025 [Candidatus Moranbacteria bacterium]|nr:hypothetical protein [Candidatus Moranbacteria bacterium]
MSKEDGEILRVPMLQCLKRITEELGDKLKDVNRLVEEKSDKKLNLAVVSVIQKAEDDFRIKVRGISHTGKMVEEEFQVLWRSYTCPAHFHLLQWGRVAFGPGYNFIYCGVISARSEILAREIGIYTHHLQIPGILSR